MEGGIPLKGPLEEGSVHFRSEDRSLSGTFHLALALGLVILSLAFLLSGQVNNFLEALPWIFFLVFSSCLFADFVYDAIRGRDVRGLLVDGDGIVDRSSWAAVGRIYWPEIKAIYGLPRSTALIGVDVTDSYLQRKSARIRFKVWLRRRIFRSPDFQVSEGYLKDSRERILKVLQNGLSEYELRSVSEAKELESGS